MRDEASQRIAIACNMLAPFTVARFTRDAELRDTRVPFVTRYKTRLSLRGVAIHARAIPCAYRVVFLRVGRHQKRLRHRRPNLFGNDVGKRELLRRAAFTGLD